MFILIWLALLGGVPAVAYAIGIRRGGNLFRARMKGTIGPYYFGLVMTCAVGLGALIASFTASPVVCLAGLALVACFVILIVLTITALTMTLEMRSDMRVDNRAMLNQCLRCGYNLTGNTSGVCPECGTPT